MLTKTARDGTAQAELTTYTYDEAVAGFHNMGLPTRAENAAGILRTRYDQMGRETQRIYTLDGSDYTLANGFDIAGRLIWQDYPDGDTVGSAANPITYDAAGRLHAVPGLVTSTTYDASGNADVFTRANGVVSTYGYSPTRGWLDSLTTHSGATAIQSMTYGRDEAGQITSVASPFTDESWTYGYDALRRLLSATNTDIAAHSRTYTYDTVGNMLTNSGVAGTYSYPTPGSPRPHAVTSVGSWTYTYDANGNMLTGAGRSFTYNGENRPTAIDDQTYVYGPDGERWKTVDSAPGGGTTLYLGGSVEIASGVMTKYLPGDAKRVGSPGDPVSETFWLHHDHQGSIQAITDAAGAPVQRFTYYPYGDRIATASAHTETKGWIGERQDATGLFYLHARYYDPVIGRFVSADPSDPLAPGVGLNRYAYAFNSPIMRVDPWGLKSSDDIDHGDVHHRGSDKGAGTPFPSSKHGGMSPLESRIKSQYPGAKVRRRAWQKYYEEKAIKEMHELISDIFHQYRMNTLLEYQISPQLYEYQFTFEFELTAEYIQKQVKKLNNTIKSGWGEWVDLSDWVYLGDIFGTGKVEINAGERIAIAASSIAWPATYQFGFTVRADPLDANGQLATIYSTVEAHRSVWYSSGPTGAGSPNVYVLEAPTWSEFGNRWTVTLPPQQSSHGNSKSPGLQIYGPRGFPWQ